MPWRSSTTATEGTVWGRVTDGAQPLDDATVLVPRTSYTTRTDGNGYYVLTMMQMDPGGQQRAYSLTAQKTGAGSRSATVTVYAGGLTVQDFVLSSNPVVTIAADRTTVTSGQSVRFTPTVFYSNGATGASYVWHFGVDTLSGSGSAVAIDRVFSVAGDFDCYLVVADTAGGSGTSNHLSIHVNPPTPPLGDLDQDSDVDLADFSYFQMCFNGPNRPINGGSECLPADIDDDHDVDLADFGTFQACFNGPNRPPPAMCIQ
jgi:hypothetical protein